MRHMEDRTHTNDKDTQPIKASMFFRYHACPHWLWFDAYGDPSKKAKTSEFAEKLIETGLLHEKRIIEDLAYIEVEDGPNDVRFKKTVGLMKEGVTRIYHGLLIAGDMIGEPDILEKRTDRSSSLGAYYYVAIEIKSAERLSDAHKYQLTFYGELLKEVQGVRPDEGYVLNGSATLIGFPLREFELRFHKALRHVRAILAGEQPPPHLSSGCKSSPWFSECIAYAEENDDIALLYNVRRSTLDKLKKHGIETVADAADADIGRLFATGDFRRKTLERLKLQARALRDGTHTIRKPFTFPETTHEYFFDIEGDPFRQLEYLFGFLVRDPAGERYESFVAERPEDERLMWEEFLAWLEGMPPEYAVYHYGSYERHRITMFADRYGGSEALDTFAEKLIDLNEVVKKHVIFPLYFYSIKDIGKYIGFERTGNITGGSESITYYEMWLEKGDRKSLEEVIEYNKDDVIATRYLKDWLVEERAKAADRYA